MKERENSPANSARTHAGSDESATSRAAAETLDSQSNAAALASDDARVLAAEKRDNDAPESAKSDDVAASDEVRVLATKKSDTENLSAQHPPVNERAKKTSTLKGAAKTVQPDSSDLQNPARSFTGGSGATKEIAKESSIGDLRLKKSKTKNAKSGDDEIVPIHDWIYWTMTALFRVFFKVGGWRLHGRRNVPKRGAVILAPNHVSLFDPPLVGCASPRRVTTMGKAELFDKKWFGVKVFPYIIQHMATFPVKRGAPDRRAIRRAQKVLRDGEALVVFPEGTRTRDGELGEGSVGLAMIAHSTKAPIVPMYLKGTSAALSPLAAKKGVRFFKTEVYFGEPLFFGEEYARKADRETLQLISDRVMQEIQLLKTRAENR